MGDKREGSGYLCHALMINHHVSCSPLSQTSILPLIYSQAGKSTEGVDLLRSSPLRFPQVCVSVILLGITHVCEQVEWSRGIHDYEGNSRDAAIKMASWTSLGVQWLTVCLPMQGTRVQSLVRDNSTCLRTTKPAPHSY